jgi:CBS domain-containing protein
MRRLRIGCLPVVQDGGRLVGILTEEDFMGLASKLLEQNEQAIGDEKKK